jgi:hypothetical protein
MPGNPRAIVAEAEHKFPVRIAIKVPGGGLGTRFEMIAERKLRRRQFTDDGNVEITGGGLRERTPPVGQGDLFIGTARFLFD